MPGHAQGHVIEFQGSAIERMEIEGRLTLCNMAVKAAARGGIVAPDDRLFDYLHGKSRVPTGSKWNACVAKWRELSTQPDAIFDG